MKNLLAGILYKSLGTVKVFPTPLTEESKVRNLINSLHPILTDKGLIRLGPIGDGGYLIPDDLEGIEACFSPGVDKICGFEKDCAERGMQVFLADKSIEKLPETNDNFTFYKRYIGAYTNEDFYSLDDFVNIALPDTDRDLLLQIDIEGFEYETFLSISKKLMKRFRIIVCEFHLMHQLWNKPFFDIISRTFEKILLTHSVVHIHPNNIGYIMRRKGIEIPCFMEFTFLRNDRIKEKTFADSFPNALDCENVDSANLVLPKCWYKSNP